MGHLTEDMTRLVAEIQVGRTERGRMMKELREATATMQRDVGHMMSDFHAAHKAMAQTQREHLRGFTAGLHRAVVTMRTEFANDLAGAHAAFFGTAAAPSGRHGRRTARGSG